MTFYTLLWPVKQPSSQTLRLKTDHLLIACGAGTCLPVPPDSSVKIRIQSQIQIQIKNTKHRLFYLKDVSTQNWPNACSLAHPLPQDTSVKTGGNWIGSSNLSADYIAPGGHFSRASGSGEIIGKTIETAALWELPRTGNLLSRV